MTAARPRTIWLVAGEDSGDQLGAKLMRALRAAAPGATFAGVGGEAMAEEGLTSLFPLDDVAVMGYLPVLARARTLLRRIRQTVDAAVRARPDVLVIIDSPGFTHAVARRVRKAAPGIPIVDYVSPSVWAWRPWRAKGMRPFIDHVMALLPFEPDAHRRLGGPPCTYVGHPLIERFPDLRPCGSEVLRREAVPYSLVVLPGSRRAEIDRLMPVFGRTLEQISRVVEVEVMLPAVTRHRALIERLALDWPVPVRILTGEGPKYAAFRGARAALAASGTVTLELALAGVPMVVAYKVSRAEELVARRLIQVSTIVLPNLILGENAVPEFVQAACAPASLAQALLPLLAGGAMRDAQLAALARIDDRMRLPEADTPSRAAARIVLRAAEGLDTGPAA
ncbi:lipid-A-disaccharide synthase [Methylobacterium sp. J-070]|uniref:lipid-A-disaccharide synthase n=1 Tax=Methylobacterium sp. J-070 TaxID=2836650 RepID=UPI001FBA3157|nr:lipid-A-disaccharide synthase [Methylobacterium sp. J-070]MCJ2051080.1 lipid-A-disaccharide synthase [Methylobacterium sp. J-070]